MQDSLGTEIPSARHITHVLLGSGSRDCGGRLAGRLYPALVRPKLLSPLLSATARAALARPARCPPHSGQTFCRNGRRDSTRPVALQVGQSWSGFMVWSKSIWDERARSEKGKCSYRCQRPIVMITVSALDLSIQGVRSSLLSHFSEGNGIACGSSHSDRGSACAGLARARGRLALCKSRPSRTSSCQPRLLMQHYCSQALDLSSPVVCETI